jgi:hypothetical protein
LTSCVTVTFSKGLCNMELVIQISNFHLLLGFQSGLFRLGFQSKSSSAFFSFFMRATCLVRFFVLDLITVKTLNEACKLPNSSSTSRIFLPLDDRGSRFRFPAGTGNFSLHRSVQNGSGAHPACYPVGTRSSFPGGKVAAAWSSPLNPSSEAAKAWVELYLHYPNTPLWRGAQLKHKDSLVTNILLSTLFSNILCALPLVRPRAKQVYLNLT